jgi:Hypoxia induced protein conserved region
MQCGRGPLPQPPPARGGGGLRFSGLGDGIPVRYITPVKTFLAILVALLMFATLGVLFAGLFGLVRGGGNPVRSNQLMRWRVILQGAALLLFMLLMTLLRS